MNKEKVLMRLWKDTMTTQRVETTKNEWGEQVETLQDVVQFAKCKLSQKILRAVVEGNLPVSNLEYKVFCSASLDVQQNDIINLTRGSQKFVFKVSKPMIYADSHMEFVVNELSEGNKGGY